MIKLKIALLLLTTFFISCSTVKYVTIPLSKPPDFYHPSINIKTQKDFFREYQNSLIKIKEWQKWYNVQIGSNYF